MSIEEKRREFLETKLAAIDQTKQGLELLEAFECLEPADTVLLNQTRELFASAELPRDRKKLEEAWLVFQNECYYWAWKFATAW